MAFGIYIHFPFCAAKCPYCDFNAHVRTAFDEEAWVSGVERELEWTAGQQTERPVVETVFFGGGTPSLMEPDVVARIVEAARALWTPAADLEVTLEANPTDAEADRFMAFAQAGVGRLSLGLQSLDDAALRFLGRNHDAVAGRRAAARAARAFGRLSVDLIYARPGQSPAAWAIELRQAIDLGAEHISPYQLTIEPGTAFHRAVARGALTPPPSDLAADLYETTQSVLERAGFEAYEVSNHARSEAARSRHNLLYWRGDDYVGVGPGAHGRLTLAGERWATTAPNGVADYIDRVRAAGLGAARERLDARAVALERLVMGLRTVEGVVLSELAALRVPADAIAVLDGLVKPRDGRLTVTPRGRPVLDRIIADLADGA